MKKLFAILFTLTTVFYGCGGHSHGNANVPKDSVSADGKTSFHGARINAETAKPVAELATLMGASKELKDVKLTGAITACCTKSGCWMKVKNGDQDMMVSFKDYAFFIPKDCTGKNAVLQGRAYYETVSADDLQHYAQDGGMSEAEAKQKFTKAEDQLKFEATGVIITNN
jgi:hypothetical protein